MSEIKPGSAIFAKKPIGVSIDMSMNSAPTLDIEYGDASLITQDIIDHYAKNAEKYIPLPAYDTTTLSLHEDGLITHIYARGNSYSYLDEYRYPSETTYYEDRVFAQKYQLETERRRGIEMEANYGLRGDPKLCDGTECGPVGEECPTCNKLVI